VPEILKISIALTGVQYAILKSAVRRGDYATTSEAVREAVREWHHRRETLRKKSRRPPKLKKRKTIKRKLRGRRKKKL